MSSKSLSVFALVMINVIAVDSIKNLPMAASFGSSVIGAYIALGLCFFIPIVLVTAELSVRYTQSGGLYHWVKAAFGAKAGFGCMWIMWIYNVIWYPTILTLASSTFAYAFFPSLVQNAFYTVAMVLGLFWVATLINFKGMRASSMVSTIGALFGTLIPLFFIAGIGAYWLYKGLPTDLAFGFSDFLPIYGSFNEYVFFAAIIFSLMGIEMSSVHAAEVKNPVKDYPKALLISAFLILLSITASSFGLAVIVPQGELDIVTGVIQVFAQFSAHLGLPLTKWFAVAITLGAIAAVVTWVIGPTKGLLACAKDGYTPKLFAKSAADNVPTNILWLQCIIVSILSIFYIFMPTIQSAYWLLSVLSAQLAMIMYMLVFAAAYKLSNTDAPAVFAPWLYKSACLLGMFTCLVVTVLGFIPPASLQLSEGMSVLYPIFLGLGMMVFVGPVFLAKHKQ